MTKERMYQVTIGQQFGEWAVIDIPPIYIGSPKALCLCVCGKKREVQMQHLLQGASKSCGCVNKKERTAPTRKNEKHGDSGTPLYKLWLDLRRISNLKRKSVDMHQPWKESYLTFKEWALSTGFASNTTLVRKDNSRGHSPENSYWQVDTPLDFNVYADEY